MLSNECMHEFPHHTCSASICGSWFAEIEKEGGRNVVSFQKIHEVKQEKKRERISSPQRAFFLLATTIAVIEMPANAIPKLALLVHLHPLPFSVR